MVYKDQSAYKLMLHLIESPPNSDFNILKSDFNVLKSKTFTWRYGAVAFGVLGASHFIRWSGKESALTEILACGLVGAMPEQTVFLGPLSNLREGKLSIRFSGNIKYEFSSKFSNDSDEFKILEKKVAASLSVSNLIGIDFAFPSLPDFPAPPRTLLVAEIERSALHFRTAHYYPNERLAVLSETIYRLKGGAKW